MAKKKNRQKEYIRGLKRAGLLKKASAEAPKATEAAASKPAVVSKASLSLQEFAAISAVEGIRANLVETLYQAGIQSVADFAQHSEADILALKGIGPATLNKLQENGVAFKA